MQFVWFEQVRYALQSVFPWQAVSTGCRHAPVMPRLVEMQVSHASPAVVPTGGLAQISVAHAVWQPPAPAPQSHVMIAWSKTPTPVMWLLTQQVWHVAGFARHAASPVGESVVVDESVGGTPVSKPGGPLSTPVLPAHAESAEICALHAFELLTTVPPLQVKSDAVYIDDAQEMKALNAAVWLAVAHCDWSWAHWPTQFVEQAAGWSAQTLAQLPPPGFTLVSPPPPSRVMVPPTQVCTTVTSCCAHWVVLTWTPPAAPQEYCDDVMPLAQSRYAWKFPAGPWPALLHWV